MKRFPKFFLIGTSIGVIFGLPLLLFVTSLKTLLIIVASFEVGALVGGTLIYTKFRRGT